MKKSISLLLSFALLVGAFACPSLSSGDDQLPALSEDDHIVRTLSGLGIVMGTDKGLELERPVTRAETIALIVRFAGLNFTEDYIEPDFEDIKGHWAEQLIMHCRRCSLVNGTSEATFEPDRYVTGRELVKILLAATGYGTLSLEAAAETANTIGLTSDNYTRGCLLPGYTLSRGDACRLLYSAFLAKAPDGGLMYRKLIADGVYSEEKLTGWLIATSEDRELTFADALNAALAEDKNYMFSPLSIKMALAMAANGAEGQTREEMLKVLQIDSLDGYNSYVQSTMERYSRDSEARLEIANSIWINTDMTEHKFAAPFQKTIEKYYSGEALTVNNRNALEKVNRWVNDKTNGKIPAVIDEPDFDVMLINAVYFKAAWVWEFDDDFTRKGTFTQKDGREKETDFMHMTDYMRYAETDKAEILSLPYKADGDISMYIVLPKAENIAVEAEVIKAVEEGMHSRYVALSMPKFKIEYEKNLEEILMDMGMGRAFDDNAEFGPMMDGYDMRINKVIHKTFIDVNERETEAAAVTAIGMVGTGMPMAPIEFNANIPFAFVVRDNDSGAVLFMGEYAYVE